MDNQWKVYYHLFPNGKYYIGITSEPRVENRWQNGAGYLTQPVYEAIKKYGWTNIEHGLIASDLTFEEANNFEALLIKKLNTILPNGYNATYGGEGTTYYSDADFDYIKRKYLEGYTKNQIKNMSKYGLWIINKVIDNLDINTQSSEYHHKRLLKYNNIDVKQIINDFKSGLTYEEISKRNNCCAEMVRRLISENFTEQERKEIGQIKQNSNNTKIKSVVQLDKNGNYINTYKSSNAAAIAINGDAKRILNICKHKPGYKTTKGYIFKFEDEYNGG